MFQFWTAKKVYFSFVENSHRHNFAKQKKKEKKNLTTKHKKVFRFLIVVFRRRNLSANVKLDKNFLLLNIQRQGNQRFFGEKDKRLILLLLSSSLSLLEEHKNEMMWNAKKICEGEKEHGTGSEKILFLHFNFAYVFQRYSQILEVIKSFPLVVFASYFDYDDKCLLTVLKIWFWTFYLKMPKEI